MSAVREQYLDHQAGRIHTRIDKNAFADPSNGCSLKKWEERRVEFPARSELQLLLEMNFTATVEEQALKMFENDGFRCEPWMSLRVACNSSDRYLFCRNLVFVAKTNHQLY